MYRIVYFVGAGLTKSLEIGSWPVPMMWDFVSTMAHYLDQDVILAAMVALEKADLYEWKSTDAANLAGQKFPPDREAFRRALKNRPAESIEGLLERALKVPANRYAQSAPDRFRWAINRLFGTVAWNVSWPPLERFLQNQIRMPDTEHTFISFNYDLILDRAVQELSLDWGPATGYGIGIPFYVQDDLPQAQPQSGAVDSVPAKPFRVMPSSRLRVLKPHGSLNWLVPYKEPYEHQPQGLGLSDGPVIVPVTPDGALRYWPSTRDYQAVSLPGELPTDVGVCILPPSSAKSSELSFLKLSRDKETEALATADEVVVIGWSMPDTDHDQADLIRAVIERRSEQGRPLSGITVVNRGATTTYFQRVAELFGVDASSLHIHNAGFSDFAAAL